MESQLLEGPQRKGPEDLRAALARAWSRATSSQPQNWSKVNPALGQCAVTALIVQDEFGGELLKAAVDGVSHYWNRLPSGQEVDLTRHQFTSFPTVLRPDVRSREGVLANADTAARYHRLKTALNRL